MKKFISLVLVLILVPSFAFASLDLSAYTADELIELKSLILRELIERGDLKEVKVPAGEYVIGIDIPVGEYSVNTSSAAVMLTVNEYETLHVLSSTESVGRLVLRDGDKLSLSGTCLFSIYTGLDF